MNEEKDREEVITKKEIILGTIGGVFGFLAVYWIVIWVVGMWG